MTTDVLTIYLKKRHGKWYHFHENAWSWNDTTQCFHDQVKIKKDHHSEAGVGSGWVTKLPLVIVSWAHSILRLTSRGSLHASPKPTHWVRDDERTKKRHGEWCHFLENAWSWNDMTQCFHSQVKTKKDRHSPKGTPMARGWRGPWVGYEAAPF